MSKFTRVAFFVAWAFFNVAGAIGLCWNVKWHWLSTWETVGAVCIMLVLTVLHIGVMESLTVSVFTLIFCGDAVREEIGNSSHLTVLLNYNVLALDPGDADEGMARMYGSYMDNLTEKVSAVYISATGDRELRRYEKLLRDRYRAKIRAVLQEEAVAYIARDYSRVHYFRQINLWRRLEDRHSLDYLRASYGEICESMSANFMCIDRVSRVLRKCGQYQDLMLLSEGRFMAFTYTDPALYGRHARPYGEPMFHDSDDVRNIHGRNFDYTLVLDCDTHVPTGVAHTLLGVAAARPDKAIVQPAIKLEAGIWDTIFMNLEDLRQRLGEPTTNALGRVFDQCGFYGKALIQNRLYIEEVIGTPDRLVEAVPIDVLSHDTYEAAILKPHFTRSAALVERPTYNYLAWNSRQRRWNLGDLIVAMYMYPRLVGAPIRALQRCVQGRKYFRPRVRTPLRMNTVTAYIANSSLRSLFTKPLWLVLVLIHGFLPVPTYYHWLPVVVVLVIICVISKLSLFMRCHKGILYLLPELISSVCQYTPEVIAGFVRFFRVLVALVRGKNDWVPQRRVDQEFDTVNPCKMLVYSYRHLWGYAVLGLALMITLVLLDITWGIYPLNSSLKIILIYFDLACIFCLPLYCFITSLRICPCACCRRPKDEDSISDDVESSVSSSDSSGRELLPNSYTTTKVIDIVKPGRGTLKSKIPMSARVFFRQLRNYAGQIAENRASWFTQKQTRPSDSFEFRARAAPSSSVSSGGTYGVSRYMKDQRYIDMSNDYFKVTTIGPPPEHQAVVKVEHEEGLPPTRPNFWRHWDTPIHSSWLDVSHAGMHKNEVTLTVEPARSDNVTFVKQNKVYYDQYGSYDTINPIDEFPDTGKVFISRKLARSPAPVQQTTRVLSDLHAIERSFPADPLYTEVNEISRMGRLYRKRSEEVTGSDADLRAPLHGVFAVIHNFDEEQPRVRPNLEEVHVFQRESTASLAPPVPPKSDALLEEWRLANAARGQSDDVEVIFRVTTDDRNRLSQSLPLLTSSGPSSTSRLERIAEEIYAEARGVSPGDEDITMLKRRHSFDGANMRHGGSLATDVKSRRTASTLGVSEGKGKESVMGAAIKRRGGVKIKKTLEGTIGYTANTCGLQGTIVTYNPSQPEVAHLEADDSQRWFSSQKIYQVGNPPPRHQFAITFQPNNSGQPGSSRFEEIGGSRKTVTASSTADVSLAGDPSAHQRRVVSGLEVDRWMHLDVATPPPPAPPPPPLPFLPVSHKIRGANRVSGIATIEAGDAVVPQLRKTKITPFNEADTASASASASASTSGAASITVVKEEVYEMTETRRGPVKYQTTGDHQVTVKTEPGDTVSVMSVGDSELSLGKNSVY